MAVLPWGQHRNNTSGNLEKTKTTSIEWFSRSNAEPSRQAISQLMKKHSRDGSSASVNLRSRSKASTPTPQGPHHRPATSVDSRPKNTSSKSSESSTPTQSRPSTPVRPSTSSLERSDSSSRSLFQKGGLLRRTGSKLSLNSNSSPVGGLVSPTRNTPSRAGSREKDVTMSPGKDEFRRPSISKPFDFAHIMHGDINAFTGLGRIDESDLALQFDAIQARYRTTTELGDPLPQEPQRLTPVVATEPVQRPATPPLALPIVPPKNSPPQPPPKDFPVASPTRSDIRTSRSTENFSRPTSRSPSTTFTTSPVRPSSCHLQHLTTLAPAVELVELNQTKPLPQIPTAVHAVSTQDDTARPLITAPLPHPPMGPDKGVTRHQRQSSSKGSLRHMSTFPSAQNPQAGTLAQEGQLVRIKEEECFARPHSDHELMQRTRHRSGNIEPSVNTHLKVEDWEVAIDSAWDLEDEAHLEMADVHLTRSRPERPESVLTIEQSQLDTVSSPSTPLMTMAPVRRSESRAGLRQTPATVQVVEDHQAKRNSANLVGLGIETDSTNAVGSSKATRPPVLEVVTSNIGRPNTSPRLTRSAYSAISHSSSQESIILSIASSIMSTQRSSVSSISPSDYAQSVKHERLSVSNSTSSPLLSVSLQKAARPESGCLPSVLLPTLKAEANKAARPDSTCLPPVSSSKRNSAIAKSNRPESMHLSREILAVFPVVETNSGKNANANSKASETEAESEDKVTDLPMDDRNTRAQTGFRASVPSRPSSALAGDSAHTTRQRSSTQGSRTRSARVSYSLFPTAGPTAHTPSNIDVGGVAS